MKTALGRAKDNAKLYGTRGATALDKNFRPRLDHADEWQILEAMPGQVGRDTRWNFASDHLRSCTSCHLTTYRSYAYDARLEGEKAVKRWERLQAGRWGGKDWRRRREEALTDPYGDPVRPVMVGRNRFKRVKWGSPIRQSKLNESVTSSA